MMMMIMEGQEEAVLCQDQLQIIKGKRTKRPRPMSPLTLAMASSTTSSGTESGGEGEVEGGRNSSDDSKRFDGAVASPTTSVELAEGGTEEEEEDMANCLILLAQGHQTRKPSEPAGSSATTSKTSTTGIYVHQCKTCNRCFPSFQALGGHRASHKRPKVISEENNNNNNKGLMFVKEAHNDQFNNMNTTLSLQITNKAVLSNSSSKSRVHECSICGAEFSSGQALGGHMRRHRTLASTATTSLSAETRSSPESEDQSKKPRTVLQLDLNLPAPEDDHHRESKFSFSSKEKLLVFSASNLVDCHY
ncbi:hypothetical protein PTKIN_Ptkin13bG0260400 [Pterospermum kingtungense]